MPKNSEQSLKHEYLYDGGPCVSSCAACAEDTLKTRTLSFDCQDDDHEDCPFSGAGSPCECSCHEEVLPPSTWTAWKLRKIAESTPEQIVEYQRHLMDATREAERDRIVALIRDMMRDHDIEGTTGYLFTGDQWNDETAEDIIGVIERGGLHV